jgi:hypothetical protein
MLRSLRSVEQEPKRTDQKNERYNKCQNRLQVCLYYCININVIEPSTKAPKRKQPISNKSRSHDSKSSSKIPKSKRRADEEEEVIPAKKIRTPVCGAKEPNQKKTLSSEYKAICLSATRKTP